jgi:hypothetical protein
LDSLGLKSYQQRAFMAKDSHVSQISGISCPLTPNTVFICSTVYESYISVLLVSLVYPIHICVAAVFMLLALRTIELYALSCAFALTGNFVGFVRRWCEFTDTDKLGCCGFTC